MASNARPIQNFILFLSLFSVLYIFSVETFLKVESSSDFPIVTIIMSTCLSFLIVTDLRLRGMYFSEIIGLLKPQYISKNQLAFTLYVSAILCALLVLAKFIILNYFTYSFPFSSIQVELFSPKPLTFNLAMIASTLIYILSCIFQEFIARSWLQDSFSLIFRNNKILPIFITAGYFSAAHLHMTPYIAILVFMLSIGWGFIYTQTNRSLYSVVISHAIVGIFAFNILGVPFELVYGSVG